AGLHRYLHSFPTRRSSDLQMMLAQALICHFLNRDWRWTGSKSDKEDMIHRMLVKWFADDNSAAQCPFSIHQLVKHGINMGKKPRSEEHTSELQSRDNLVCR